MNSNKPADLKDPVAMTYLVSFLHALPFNYQIGPLPFKEVHDLFQFPSSQELVEIGQELGLNKLNQRLTVPLPHNPLYMLNNRAALCETLMSCLPWTEYIGLAMTLTSMMYPFHYGWNRLAESLESLSTRETLSWLSISSFPTETYYYEQFKDGIIIRKDDSYHVYQNQAYIPPRIHSMTGQYPDYPYRWTSGIEDYCVTSGHHPACTSYIGCGFIEREFIAQAVGDPTKFGILDEYLNVIYMNGGGRNLQWLCSSTTPVGDNIMERVDLTTLYSQVDEQGGQIFHTKKGLHITIPEEKWINWRTFSPTSQKKFMRVAWAQLTQFDKTALMTGLKEGKLDELSVYFDFDDNAKHDQFWQKELDSVHRYYIKLITTFGVFHTYNGYVIQELAYNNEPLQLNNLANWEVEECPRFIFLPYSSIMMRWSSGQHKWEIKTHSEDSLSSASSMCSSNGSIYNHNSYSVPSLIDCDKYEDGEIID